MNFMISVSFQRFFLICCHVTKEKLNKCENIESSNIDFYTPVASCSYYINLAL